MKLLKLLSFGLLLISIGTSCTRKVDATNAISIDGKAFKNKIDTASGQMPMIVLFNLHFDGKTEVAEWECQAMRDDNLQDTAKFNACWNELQTMQFDFNGKEFPSGQAMLLQLIVVMVKPYEGTFTFEYIDKSLNLASGTNRHVLRFDDFQTVASSSGTGDLKARFVDLAGDADLGTGLVLGEIKPKPDKPSMRLFKNAIYDGWVSLFFLDSLPVTYRLVDPLNPETTKKVLFEAKTLNDIEAMVSGSSAARVFSVPSHYEIDQEDSLWKSRREEGFKFIAGYFDSNSGAETTGTYSVDFPVADHSYSDLHYNTDGLDPLVDETSSSLRPNSFQLTWDVDNASDDYVKISSGNTAPDSCYVSGDVISSSCMLIRPESIMNKDSFMYGPFQEVAEGKLVNGAVAGNIHTLSWAYLPGVSSKLSGAVAFAVPRWASEILKQSTGDGIACRKLAAATNVVSNINSESLASYEQSIPVYQASLLSTGVTSLSVDTSGFPSTTEDVSIFVCPYFTHASSGKKIFLDEAAEYRIHSSSGNSNSVATKLKLTQVFPSANINQSTCTPVILESVDDNGNHAELPSSGHIAVSSVNGNIYLDADCTTLYSGENINDPHHFHKLLYVETTLSSGSFSAESIGSSGLTGFGSEGLNLNIASGNTAAQIGSTFIAGDSYVHNCQEFYVANLDASGAVVTENKSYTLTNSNANGSFYYDYDACLSGGATTTGFGLGIFDSKRLYYRPATASATNLGISAAGLTGLSIAVSPSLPGSPYEVHGYVLENYNMSTPVVHTGFCHKLQLKMYDSNHKYTQSGTTEAIDVFLNDSDVYLYPSSSDCFSDTSRILSGGSFNIPSLSTFAELYVRVGVAGPHSIDLHLQSSTETRTIDFEVDQTIVNLVGSNVAGDCYQFSPSYETSYTEIISGLDTYSMATGAGSGFLLGSFGLASNDASNIFHSGASCGSSISVSIGLNIDYDSSVVSPTTMSFDKPNATSSTVNTTPFGVVFGGVFPW